MTDNISRLYRLSNIDKVFYVSADIFEDGYDLNSIKEDYPPFTGTKQLELIKWLTTNWGSFALYKNEDGFLCGCHSFSSCFCEKPEEALAGLVCELWEDLTDEQREEVRGILQ